MPILHWIKKKIIVFKSSIAFYPAIIACGFLVLSWLMIMVDFSVYGKAIKLKLSWLRLKDANTARVIISTIVAGILSLTVFSFSMVMIVLNQAASQMSNRMLSSMIQNRFQQIVLGFYIGSMVYALFLLSTIRDIHSGIYVPALSIYLLIFLTVVDIFMFIYFLDYVTKSVKYNTVIKRVMTKTFDAMRDGYNSSVAQSAATDRSTLQIIDSQRNGYFQGFNSTHLVGFAQEENIVIHFLHPVGSFVLAGTSLLGIEGKAIDRDQEKTVLDAVDFFDDQPIELQPVYGFKHLTEVAVRALSPGINDPATAVLCLNSLGELFAFRFFHHPPISFLDNEKRERIIMSHISPEDLWKTCIDPIWQYGEKDFLVRAAFSHILHLLLSLPLLPQYRGVLSDYQKKVFNQ